MKQQQNYNKWLIILGQNGKDYFDSNLTQVVQKKLVQTIYEMSWEKVYHDQSKIYHYEDMKYIINNRNKHICHKTKVLSYDIQQEAFMAQYTLVSVPIDKFPPITEYHDMMIIERTVFMNKSHQIQIRTINHYDTLQDKACVGGHNEITYEIRIESSNKEEAIELANKLNYKLNEFKPKYIEHGSYYILSII